MNSEERLFPNELSLGSPFAGTLLGGSGGGLLGRMQDRSLELCAFALGTPLEDVILVARTDIVEPSEILQVTFLGRNQGQGVHTAIGRTVELDFVHLLVVHEQMEQVALGMNHANHEAVGIEREVVDKDIALDSGQVHLLASEIRAHDIACNLIVAGGIYAFHRKGLTDDMRGIDGRIVHPCLDLLTE